MKKKIFLKKVDFFYFRSHERSELLAHGIISLRYTIILLLPDENKKIIIMKSKKFRQKDRLYNL